MNKEIYVATGEVKSGKDDLFLKSNGIGSCVVVVAYDKFTKVGGLAHVMLSGVDNRVKVERDFKYAKNAIEELFMQLKNLGSLETNVEVCLVGGANVLLRKGDVIGVDNINSVERYLKQYDIKILKKSVGGVLRRTVCLKLQEGKVYYTKGDSMQRLLYNFN